MSRLKNLPLFLKLLISYFCISIINFTYSLDETTSLENVWFLEGRSAELHVSLSNQLFQRVNNGIISGVDNRGNLSLNSNTNFEIFRQNIEFLISQINSQGGLFFGSDVSSEALQQNMEFLTSHMSVPEGLLFSNDVDIEAFQKDIESLILGINGQESLSLNKELDFNTFQQNMESSVLKIGSQRGLPFNSDADVEAFQQNIESFVSKVIDQQSLSFNNGTNYSIENLMLSVPEISEINNLLEQPLFQNSNFPVPDEFEYESFSEGFRDDGFQRTEVAMNGAAIAGIAVACLGILISECSNMQHKKSQQAHEQRMHQQNRQDGERRHQEILTEIRELKEHVKGNNASPKFPDNPAPDNPKVPDNPKTPDAPESPEPSKPPDTPEPSKTPESPKTPKHPDDDNFSSDHSVSISSYSPVVEETHTASKQCHDGTIVEIHGKCPESGVNNKESNVVYVSSERQCETMKLQPGTECVVLMDSPNKVSSYYYPGTGVNCATITSLNGTVECDKPKKHSPPQTGISNCYSILPNAHSPIPGCVADNAHESSKNEAWQPWNTSPYHRGLNNDRSILQAPSYDLLNTFNND